jgi:methyl-accepting chemotaxis protein
MLNQVLQPAIKAMSLLSFRYKFAIVYLCFALPIGILFSQFWSATQESLSTSQKELVGSQVQSQLIQVLDKSSKAKSEALNKAFGNGLSLKGLPKQFSAAPNKSDVLKDIKNSKSEGLIKKLNSSIKSLSYEQSAQSFKTFSEQLSFAYKSAAIEFSLNSDSNPIVNAFVSQAFLFLPEMLSTQESLMLTSSELIQQGSFTPDLYIRISADFYLVQSALSKVVIPTDLGNKDLENSIKLLIGKANDFNSLVKKELLDSDSISISSSLLFQSYSDLLNAYTDVMVMSHSYLEDYLSSHLSHLKSNLIWVFTSLTVGVLLSVYFLTGLYKQLLSSTFAFKLAAEQLNSGDLTQHLEVSSKDEMKLIEKSFNRVIDAFRTMVSDGQSSAGQLSQVSESLQKITVNTASGVDTQKQQTGALRDAMSELDHKAKGVDSEIIRANDSAKLASHQANDSQAVVSNAAASIESMVSEISKSATVISQLAEQVDTISETSKSINGIAEQTNLLALNAAIEAARAGEQGRGFAVVADEVRNLAMRTQSSTEEIQQTIVQLQDVSNGAVAMMQSCETGMAETREQMLEADNTLQQILVACGQIGEIMANVSEASQDQSSVIKELEEVIQNIYDVAESTAEDSNQTLELSDELKTQAEQQLQQVKRFRLP